MKSIFSGICILILLSSCGSLDFMKKKPKEEETLSLSKTEPYERIIPKTAETQEGLFTIHKVKDKYFFELHDSILNREIIVVSRFVKTPSGASNYGGEEIGKKTILWEKGPLNKIFLRVVTLVSVANEDDAISKAVNNSNITPIIEAFDIKAENKEGDAYVIDVTNFINSENPLLALNTVQKNDYKLSSLEKDKSYIKNITSFPINTEVKTVKTYKAKSSSSKKDRMLPAAQMSGVVTIEINNSFVLLPKTPMRKRYYDNRVGYFASSYLEYEDDQQQVNKNTYIHRWRLEPKEEDIAKWKNGELVTPKKPIIYYIDPATPKKWRPYLIAGINDWQKAFEQAGFKNAIVGKEWPVNDTLMSLEDARFSVLRYFASPFKNAYGPNIVDPRSGEILESHIGWYHNLMTLLHSWYMVQAGVNDVRARKMKFDDELMGSLIRFVSSHEVGHTLGLRHNMGASHATPTEKLRDKDWLKKYGHTSSIMDYARFNYVAQPEDSIAPAELMPRINDYDKWAIQWGYTKFSDTLSVTKENEFLSQWVTDSIANNKRLWFGGEGRDFDPRSQSEDLGDNAILASTYGINNLKRIIPNLEEWTREKDSDDYTNLNLIYNDVVKQYSNYIDHVTKYLGGIFTTPKTMGEEGNVYQPVPKELQRDALLFLDEHIFNEPKWLLNSNILNKIKAPQSKKTVTKIMENLMMSLIGASRISRMNFIADRYNYIEAYKPEEYMDDLNNLVWKDLSLFYENNSYRRDLQKAYITNLIALYKPEEAKGTVAKLLASLGEGYTSNTDVRSLAYSNLLIIHDKISESIPSYTDRLTVAHLEYLKKQIEEAIDYDKHTINPFNRAVEDLTDKTKSNE